MWAAALVFFCVIAVGCVALGLAALAVAWGFQVVAGWFFRAL